MFARLLPNIWRVGSKLQGVDFIAEQFAQRVIDGFVLAHAALADKGGADDGGVKVRAVVTFYVDVFAGQTGEDEALDFGRVKHGGRVG